MVKTSRRHLLKTAGLGAATAGIEAHNDAMMATVVAATRRLLIKMLRDPRYWHNTRTVTVYASS